MTPTDTQVGDQGEEPCPKRGEIRVINGNQCRFIERELEGDKWEIIGPAPHPIRGGGEPVAWTNAENMAAIGRGRGAATMWPNSHGQHSIPLYAHPPTKSGEGGAT